MLKLAVTVLLASMTTVQLSVPVQGPLQPTNKESALGSADRVIDGNAVGLVRVIPKLQKTAMLRQLTLGPVTVPPPVPANLNVS